MQKSELKANISYLTPGKPKPKFEEDLLANRNLFIPNPAL